MENALVFAFAQFLLLPVLIVNGRYFQVGFRTLLKGSPNMDPLIAIGSGAAAVYGIYAICKIDERLKQPNCPFLLYVGTKKLVKRKAF